MTGNANDAESETAKFADEVKRLVDAKMRALLDARFEAARCHGENAAHAIDAIRSLALRGGKRLRAVLLAAAYEACGGDGGAAHVTSAGVAMELLQTYLLVHDDWMDEDDVRRGGASVHAMLRERFVSRHHGDSAAILGGDYACALAQESLLDVQVPAVRSLAAARLFATIQEEVVLGQLLDVNPIASRSSHATVESMHDLKTGSYTVRGPVILGALLAGATDAQRLGLVRFAKPLGVAFQLRDDLLGTFGDEARIGKPVGSDIRKGKRTSLIAAIEEEGKSGSALDRAFGVDDASDEDVDAVRTRIVQSGAKEKVEARLASLTKEALDALAAAPIEERGRECLRAIATSLVDRDH